MLQLGIRGLGIARFKFNPISWFLKGEPGAWYDPSNLTTLFQDSAGTTPVTAVEQPVGLMLDKSRGLALGAELVTNGDFATDTWWTKTGSATISGGAGHLVGSSSLEHSGVVVIGNWYVITYTTTIRAGNVRVQCGGAQGVTYTTSGTYTNYVLAAAATTFYIVGTATTDADIDNISVKQIAGNHAFQATTGNRPVLSARVNGLLATATLSTQSVTSLATNYTLSFTGTGTVTLSGTATGVLSAGTNTFTATAGTLTLTVSGSVTLADLRPTNSGALLPPYQRVNTASDYDTVGFPLYLKANGTSSAMSTNISDFRSTDKMTVVTGVRKLSDANQGDIVDLGIPAQVGSFFMMVAQGNGVPNYAMGITGTTLNYFSPMTYTAPIGNVVSLLADISQATKTAELNPRINGVVNQTNSVGTDAGSGTFGNYPIYLFARTGTSGWFNGQFYGAIIRGADSDTASVTQTENYMAQKTGITF